MIRSQIRRTDMHKKMKFYLNRLNNDKKIFKSITDLKKCKDKLMMIYGENLIKQISTTTVFYFILEILKLKSESIQQQWDISMESIAVHKRITNKVLN